MAIQRRLRLVIRSIDPPLAPFSLWTVGGTISISTDVDVTDCAFCEETIEYDPNLLQLLNALPVYSHGFGTLRSSHTWQLRATHAGATEVCISARTDFAEQPAIVPIKIQEDSKNDF